MISIPTILLIFILEINELFTSIIEVSLFVIALALK
jgi:hypothetical protein